MLHIDSSNGRTDTETSDDAVRPKWFASPVVFHEGALVDMVDLVPVFERRPLALTQENGMLSRINQHQDVLRMALSAFERNGLAPGDIRTEMELTEYGERMALSMYTPHGLVFGLFFGHRRERQT